MKATLISGDYNRIILTVSSDSGASPKPIDVTRELEALVMKRVAAETAELRAERDELYKVVCLVGHATYQYVCPRA